MKIQIAKFIKKRSVQVFTDNLCESVDPAVFAAGRRVEVFPLLDAPRLDRGVYNEKLAHCVKKIFYLIFVTNILISLLSASADILSNELVKESEKKSLIHESSVVFCKIQNISDVIPFVDKNTLAFFDLDETLILDPDHSYNRKVPHLKPVEGDETVKTFKNVQAKALGVMGLTARSYRGAKDVTLKTLKSVGMPLFNPFHQIKGYIFLDDKKTGFWNGIIFTHCRPKGEFLNMFLQKLKAEINFSPAKILFIDDLEKNCLSVQKSLEELRIPGIIFHYMGAHDLKTSV